MSLEKVESEFYAYLDRSPRPSCLTPFLLSYAQLLLSFKGELTKAQLNILIEREKQLRGDNFNDGGFEEARRSSRKEMDRALRENTDSERPAALNRLLFCALLDADETDVFYLAEPIFQFARRMEVSPDSVAQILASEFAGFNSHGAQS